MKIEEFLSADNPTGTISSLSGTEMTSSYVCLALQLPKMCAGHLRMLARLASGDVSELGTELLASSDYSAAIRSATSLNMCSTCDGMKTMRVDCHDHVAMVLG